MRHEFFVIFLIAFVIVAYAFYTSYLHSNQSDATCFQRERGNSSLNFVFAFHDLKENNASHYYSKSIEFIRSVEPFNIIDFNVYEISVTAEECWTVTENFIRPQLRCDWSRINARLEACKLPNLKLVIITGSDVQTVSAQAYYNTTLAIINERDFSRYTLLHEIGHLFGLQEEATRLFVPQTSSSWLPRKPNCASSIGDAEAWWGKHVGISDTGYYPGCAGHEEFIRPNNVTLMGNGFDYSDYGYVSTAYLENVMNCCYAANRSNYECTEFFEEYPEWSSCKE